MSFSIIIFFEISTNDEKGADDFIINELSDIQ